jgi:heme exporter protein A
LPVALSIEAVALACIRGDRVLFEHLDFKVASGGVLSVEGPNGSGKTSLLRIIAGFLVPSSGAVKADLGDCAVSDAEDRGRLVAWLGHRDGAKSQFTPAESLAFEADLYGAARETGDALSRVGLSQLAKLPCQYLSAGQKKRLALARLLVCRRPLWLLDEPLSSLDAAGKRLVAELVNEHRREGGITIAATHEPLGPDCDHLKLGAG